MSRINMNLCHLHLYIYKDDMETLNEISSRHGDKSHIVRSIIRSHCKLWRDNKKKETDDIQTNRASQR